VVEVVLITLLHYQEVQVAGVVLIQELAVQEHLVKVTLAVLVELTVEVVEVVQAQSVLLAALRQVVRAVRDHQILLVVQP
jgi:hypothetical protein